MKSFPSLLLGLEDLPRSAPERCLRHWHRRSACSACAEVCPEGALSLEDGLRLDVDRCAGCMLCVAACPTGALDWRDEGEGLLGQLGALLAADEKVAGVLAACPESPAWGADDPLLRVPCIGCVSPALIVLAVARGAQGVLLDRRACESCSWTKGPALAARSVAQAEGLLGLYSHWGRSRAESALPPGDNGQVSRRGFFSKLGRRLGEAAALALLPEDGAPSRAAPRQPALPRERAWLSQAVGLLGYPKVSQAEAEGIPFYPLLVAEQSCDGCGFCGKFCPTAALKVAEGEQDWRLIFRLSRCVGCGLCLESCPQEVFSWAPHLDTRQLGVGESLLASGRSRTCPVCRSTTVRSAGERVCARCWNQLEIEESFLEMMKV